MNKHIVIKSIALLLAWLTLSPLLLILDGRWGLLPKWLRVLLFLLSPMMLIVYAVVAFLCYDYYVDYYSRHHFVRSKVVENITGVRFPKYKVIEYKPSNSRIDRSDSFTLEFNEMPTAYFYGELAQCFFKWTEDDRTEYSYDCIWGNGLPAPKGESDKDDYDFKVKIIEGERVFHIEVSAW